MTRIDQLHTAHAALSTGQADAEAQFLALAKTALPDLLTVVRLSGAALEWATTNFPDFMHEDLLVQLDQTLIALNGPDVAMPDSAPAAEPVAPPNLDFHLTTDCLDYRGVDIYLVEASGSEWLVQAAKDMRSGEISFGKPRFAPTHEDEFGEAGAFPVPAEITAAFAGVRAPVTALLESSIKVNAKGSGITLTGFTDRVNALKEKECQRLNAQPDATLLTYHHPYPEPMMASFFDEGLTPDETLKAMAANLERLGLAEVATS